MLFPILILWNVRIDLKRKMILFSIFSLVTFTIGITIARGIIFRDAYKSLAKQMKSHMNVTWLWFWVYIENSVCKQPRSSYFFIVVRQAWIDKSFLQRSSSPLSSPFERYLFKKGTKPKSPPKMFGYKNRRN